MVVIGLVVARLPLGKSVQSFDLISLLYFLFDLAYMMSMHENKHIVY